MRKLFLFLLLFSTSKTDALELQSDEAFLKADKVLYNDKLKKVEAIGNVNLYFDGRNFIGPKITYFFERDEVIIDQDSQIIEQTGQMLAIKSGQLKEKMTQGLGRHIRILLGPEIRLAAQKGELVNEKKIILHNALYSPCKLCRFPDVKEPLWQMRASKIIYDKEQEVVHLRNAFLEFEGIPIFYTPYFFYPAQRTKRKSGFLLPEHITSNRRHMIATPYYYTFSPQNDVILKPIIAFNDEQLLFTDYRHLFHKGFFSFKGSAGRVNATDNDYRLQLPEVSGITKSRRELRLKDKHQFHGHIASTLALHLSEIARAGVDINLASNKTYLKRYRFSDRANLLTSKAYGEAFYDAHYANIQGFYFQGLRSFDRQRNLPQLLPLIEGQYLHDVNDNLFKGTLSLKTDTAFTHRSVGPHAHRTTLIADWQRHLILPAGFTSSLLAENRYDHYFIPGYTQDNVRHRQKDLGRVIPLFSASLSYPLINEKECATFTLEPIGQATFTPLLSASRKRVPNLDSEGFELDETSLFSKKRFAGFDRFFDGSHIDYGIKGRADFKGGQWVDAFIGQGYHFQTKRFDFQDLGFINPLTDYVGKIAVSPLSGLTFSERFRVDAKNYRLERNELGITYSHKRITSSTKHIYLRDSSTLLNIAPRNELQQDLTVKINDYWRFKGNATFAFNQKASMSARNTRKIRPLLYGAGLFYEDECFLINGQITRDETTNQTHKAGINTFLHFSFKPMG